MALAYSTTLSRSSSFLCRHLAGKPDDRTSGPLRSWISIEVNRFRWSFRAPVLSSISSSRWERYCSSSFSLACSCSTILLIWVPRVPISSRRPKATLAFRSPPATLSIARVNSFRGPTMPEARETTRTPLISSSSSKLATSRMALVLSYSRRAFSARRHRIFVEADHHRQVVKPPALLAPNRFQQHGHPPFPVHRHDQGQ